ncbi:hypothetical protein [Frondihabitans australicus]|uniref:Uncharacterized protein n=1 Tax=Frondihabitans australicus TaxID=386892 RepID=A0A495IGD8_9MICO|nr:hypothetical protein [Frondihabitans australicus]RKR74809.1 hypothetical protein C8E83_1940 [Frondihabitans australicus]
MSTYLPGRGVLPVKIRAYPKRRFSSYFTLTTTTSPAASRVSPAGANSDPCYADFFQPTDTTSSMAHMSEVA